MKTLLQNLKMSRKIMIAPFIVMIFMVTIAAISYRGMSSQKNALDDILSVRFQTYQDVSELVIQMTTLNKNVYRLLGLANSGMDAGKIETMGKELLKAMNETKALVKGIAAKPSLDKQEKPLVEGALKALDSYEALLIQVVKVTDMDATMAITMMTPIENRFQELNGKLRELQVYEQQLSRQKHASAGDTFNLAVRSFLVTLVVAIILSLLVSLSLAGLITRPLRQTIGVIQEIAEGDLTQQIAITSKDEIGMLAQSVDEMRQKMGEAVGGSVATSQTLAEAASEQAASLEETSSSMEEMASMTKSNAESTAKANGLMADASRTIEKANLSMTQLTASMTEIAYASEQTQKIVKTIDEISFQTNLLALNAAVEAARAGEAGAGFAVVADEVRKLALRAAEAAKNTSNLMADIVGKIRAGEQLVQATNGDFLQMRTSSKAVVELMGGIAAASQEQSEGIVQMNTAILEMNRVTQQNAASAEELVSIMSIFITGNGNGMHMKNPGTKRHALVRREKQKLHIDV
jgi:methyl-accepting chemotaxis protein